jgi:predicted O-methyltransferase YrrM
MHPKLSKLRDIVSTLSRQSRTNPELEIVYRDLFMRDIAKVGMEDVYYPVGHAANYSLLYLVMRCVRELKIHEVLELGAGQTTILLDQAKRALAAEYRVRTIEHDPLWAEKMAELVSHEIVQADLSPLAVGGRNINYYDPKAIAVADRKYDLIIVDGPPAFAPAMRYDRTGIATVVEYQLAPEFVIVFDDAERDGEVEAISSCRRLLRSHGVRVVEGQVSGFKRQHVFATPAHAQAAFF